MRSMTLNQLYSETVKWFNEVFGTALEDLPEGEIGVGSRCVLANALTQNINASIEWSVGMTSISPILPKNISSVYLGERTLNIPVTLGNECMNIEDKRWKSEPALYEDYTTWSETGEPIALPDYVTLAESFGHVGIRIESPADVKGALEEAFAQENRLVFMDFITDQSENVYPMIAAGGGHNEMHLKPSEADDVPLERELA